MYALTHNFNLRFDALPKIFSRVNEVAFLFQSLAYTERKGFIEVGSNIDFAYGVAALDNGTIIAVGDTSSSDGDIENNKGFTDLLKIVLK